MQSSGYHQTHKKWAAMVVYTYKRGKFIRVWPHKVQPAGSQGRPLEGETSNVSIHAHRPYCKSVYCQAGAIAQIFLDIHDTTGLLHCNILCLRSTITVLILRNPYALQQEVGYCIYCAYGFFSNFRMKVLPRAIIAFNNVRDSLTLHSQQQFSHMDVRMHVQMQQCTDACPHGCMD